MAKLATFSLLLIISCLFMSTSARWQFPAVEEEEAAFFHDICGGGKEKLLRLRFYVHDLRIGHVAPTVYEVAKASVTANSPVDFGSVHVVDDLLTEGPDIKSKAVGRIQGLTTNADMRVFGIAMNLNFLFTEGRFNGSTLSILGRNQVMDPQREMPVVGGTGVFRFARGYAIQTSVSFDQPSKYAVLEYNIYVTYNPKFNAAMAPPPLGIAKLGAPMAPPPPKIAAM